MGQIPNKTGAKTCTHVLRTCYFGPTTCFVDAGNEEHVPMHAVTASSPGTVTPAQQHLPDTAVPDVSAVSKLSSPSPSTESTVSVPSMTGSSAPSETVTHSQEVSSLHKVRPNLLCSILPPQPPMCLFSNFAFV